MYHKIYSFVCMLICVVFAGCTNRISIPKVSFDKPIAVMHVTDLHYLSPLLFDDGPAFEKLMNTNDGKATPYSRQILDELVKEAILRKPNLFVLSGDLTFNGEMQSLYEVREALRKITAAGIPVVTIPGNHDIGYIFANSYLGDEISSVDRISQDQYQSVMKEFGYEQAIAKDSHSFSYVIELSDTFRILLIDGNTNLHIGEVLPETLDWIEEQLQDADRQNKRVMTVTHQNVLPQSDLLYEGYIFHNADKLEKMMTEYGVSLNLSGHSHLMHQSEKGTFTDICTGAVALYPLRYGWVEILPDGEWVYQKQHLQILQTEAKKEFEKTITHQIASVLADYNISNEDKEKMIRYAVDFNIAYFTQEAYHPAKLLEMEGYQLWQRNAADTMWFYYISETLRDTKVDDSLMK